MKKNFFKELLNVILYPMPAIGGLREVWREFVDKATFSRVEEAFRENKDCVFYRCYRNNLEVILMRLAKGNWPVLTDEFIEKHSLKIWKISSVETLDYEIKSYNFVEPRYLIDAKNQMLGIVVSKDVVITGLVNEAVKARLPYKNLMGLLPTEKQMRIIGRYREDINGLLRPFGLELASNYWVETDKGRDVMVWAAPKDFRPCLGDNDLACLMFLA